MLIYIAISWVNSYGDVEYNGTDFPDDFLVWSFTFEEVLNITKYYYEVKYYNLWKII